MVSKSALILLAAFSLIVLALYLQFYGFKEKTLADEVTSLEREFIRNPPQPTVVRECNRKMMEVLNRLNVSEGMHVPYAKAEGEVILVAVSGNCLECEKKIGVKNSKLTYKPYGKPTIWVLINPEALDGLYNMSYGNHTRRDIVLRGMEYLSDSKIRVHPYSRVSEMFVEVGGGA